MTRRNTPLALLGDGADGLSAPPAFVVNAATGMLIWANDAARKAWGLPDSAGRTAVAIDRAMPALRQLASAGRTRAGTTLTFWAAGRLLRLRCRVEAVGPDADTFLVRGLSGAVPHAEAPASGGQSTSAAAGSPDAHAIETPALARLAHEIRTPLSAAIAYAEVLKGEHFGPLADARYREYARNLYDSARHALSVIDGMLASDPGGAGLPELEFRDLDPAGVIDNCLAVARPLAERAGLSIVTRLDPGTPRVIADEVSLKQMLLNLITNAIKFARPGDKVTLGADYGVDGCLRIEVADTGPGMAARALPLREEDAALQAPARRPDIGLGIGLPLTRALAEANGAALIVDSAPGRGTRVTIAFGKDRVVPV